MRDLDVHDQAPVEGDDEAHAGVVHVEAADDASGAALEDADDAPFGAAVRDPLDARHDAVAVHRLIQVAAGDVDVARHLLERLVRHDEPEPARVRGDTPDDEVHPVRQAETVAARLNQVPGRDELVRAAV